jgi:hypothetical protein
MSALVVGSPTARRLILAAAVTYACINAGDTLSTLATLSKPSLESSPGSSTVASIGRSSRSRTALPYSVRLRRWRDGAPGLGAANAARSIVFSTVAANASSVVRSGRGAPLGGIMPVRTLRTTFSQVCASLYAPVTARASSARPPARVRPLWQVSQ